MSSKTLRFSGYSFALLAALLITGLSTATAGNRDASKRIVGIWNAHVNITNCLSDNVPGPVVFASFDTMNAFLADGTYLDANAQNPALQSGHLGYWRHLRGNKYEFAQKFFMFDAAGALTGWRIVRHKVRLHKNGLSFTSGGYAETFDTDGLLVATGCSTSSALRFD